MNNKNLNNLKKNRLLSYVFKLQKHAHELDFVDLDLESDSQLYVDPILLYRSPLSDFNAAHTLIVEFFNKAIKFVKQGKEERAISMCQFHDAENLLGIAESGPGHGPRKALGRRIYEELVNNKNILEHGLTFLNEFQLLIDGISFDLVSDAAVQISKDVFIRYTTEQCEINNIPVENNIIRYFDWEEYAWDSKTVDLPVNPLKNDQPFLLTPRTLVRRYPQGNYKEFYKEIYKYVLYEKEKADLWKSLGKEPKVSFTELSKKYNKKSKVVVYVKEHPKSKDEFYKKIKEKDEIYWLEQLALSLGKNINQVLSVITFDVLKNILKEEKELKLIERAKVAAQHQLELSQPKIKLIGEIEEVVIKTKEKMMLLLGNYKNSEGQKRLNEIREVVSKDYQVILISDLVHPSESLQETVLRMSALARFVIVEDSYPGGQLFEIATIVGKGFISGILRQKGLKSSYMSVGVEGIGKNIEEFEYELLQGNGIDPENIQTVIEWAEETYSKKTEFWKEKYPWQ